MAKLRRHLVAEIQSRQPAAVTKPKPPLDQWEDQLRRLLSNRAAPVPVNKLLQRLVSGHRAGGCEFTRARGVRIVPLRTTDIGTTDSADTSQKGSDGVGCFSCGQLGHAATRCPALENEMMVF